VPTEGPRHVWRAGGPPPPPPPGPDGVGGGMEPPPSGRPGQGTPPTGGPPSVPPPPGPPPSSPPGPSSPPTSGGPAGPGDQPAWTRAPEPSGSAAGRLLPLRPLTVGDVLDGAFRALRATFATAALVILLVQGPFQLLSSLVLVQALPELMDPVSVERMVTEGAFDAAVAARAVAYGGGVMIVGLLIQVLVGGALAWVALRTDRGEEVGPGAALRASLAVSGATLGGTVLVGGLGFLVLFVVAFVVALLFALAAPLGVIGLIVAIPAAVIGLAALFGSFYLVIPIAVAEERGAWTTFRRAMWVTRRRFWRVAGMMMLLGLVIAAVSFGFSVALGALSELAGDWSWIVDGVAATATALVTVPVTIFVALLLYLDARVRLEGYDLEVRARGLGTS
jgi:hypothetical protein